METSYNTANKRKLARKKKLFFFLKKVEMKKYITPCFKGKMGAQKLGGKKRRDVFLQFSCGKKYEEGQI